MAHKYSLCNGFEGNNWDKGKGFHICDGSETSRWAVWTDTEVLSTSSRWKRGPGILEHTLKGEAFAVSGTGLSALTITSVLNLWVVAPLGVKGPFHRGHLKPLENTDIYITIHNSGKIHLWSSNKKNFMVGITHHVLWGNSITEVKNHWNKRSLDERRYCPPS